MEADAPRHGAQGLAGGDARANLVEVDLCAGTPDVLAARAGPPLPLHAALHDDPPFELSQGPDDAEHGATERRARVQVLAVRDERNVEPLELVQRRHQVLDRPGEAVEAVDKDGVELPLACGVHEPVELRALVAGAADALVDELRHDVEAAMRRVLPQRVGLHGGRLIQSANARVSAGAHGLGDAHGTSEGREGS